MSFDDLCTAAKTSLNYGIGNGTATDSWTVPVNTTWYPGYYPTYTIAPNKLEQAFAIVKLFMDEGWLADETKLDVKKFITIVQAVRETL